MNGSASDGSIRAGAWIDPADGAPLQLHVVILGLSLSSSWGNGHATTYRALLRELHRRGHRVAFLERDVPWYANTRDLLDPPFCDLHLYEDLETLRRRYEALVRGADAVIVGSFVPEGVDVARWVLDAAGGVRAFYDIDTPVTLAKLDRGDHEYLAPEVIPGFDLYLSFTGGPTLDRLEREFGARSARALYCSVDSEEYFPEPAEVAYDLGYMGTYSADRQPPLEARLLDAARAWPEGRFVVAGPGYPPEVRWTDNVERISHLAPSRHRAFYNAQRFTLNVTRADMVRVGYAPSVRLFEAAACSTPIISDSWEGLDEFFEPGREILVSSSGGETLEYLRGMSDEERREIGRRGRERVLSAHTAAHRARELEEALVDVMKHEDPTYVR